MRLRPLRDAGDVPGALEAAAGSMVNALVIVGFMDQVAPSERSWLEARVNVNILLC
jgi:hypothetical protein